MNQTTEETLKYILDDDCPYLGSLTLEDLSYLFNKLKLLEKATKFKVGSCKNAVWDDIYIEKCCSNPYFDNKDVWAIRNSTCRVFTKNFEWIYEPMPSHRTDEFFMAARYQSFEEALHHLESSGELNGN